MAVHAISYDLNRPGQNYADLYAAIKGLGAWWHYLDSTWLVDTTRSADQIWAALRPHLDKNDHMLVIDVGADHEGWLPQEAWDWISQRL